MCFVDSSPYSHKLFYEHFGLKQVKVDSWLTEKIDQRRRISFIIPESSPIFRTEIRANAVQKYSFSKFGLSLLSKYTFKHEKFNDVDIETNLEIKPINSGSYKSMVTYKLFVYRGDQKKVAKKVLEQVSEYFKTEALYWAKEIIEHRLVGDRKGRKKRLKSGNEIMKDLEGLEASELSPQEVPSNQREKHLDNRVSVRTYSLSSMPSFFSQAERLLKSAYVRFSHTFDFIFHPKTKNDKLDFILLVQFLMTIAAVYIILLLLNRSNN